MGETKSSLTKLNNLEHDDDSNARRSLLVDENGNPINADHRLKVDAELEVGSVTIGAVELKDHDSDTRADIQSDGINNVLMVGANNLDIRSLSSVSDSVEVEQLDETKLKMTMLNSLIPTKYDYISLSYTGANLTGVVYKTGGSDGTVVATLTLVYDGSNVLQTVTRS